MAIKLIVGLGNPGAKYLETRHNAGFWFIDSLLYEKNITLAHSAKFKGELGDFIWQADKRFVLKPTTFMNASGESLQLVSHYYKISPDEILVAHDELDLPAGVIRLKKSGGHGGHNGLRSIISHLGSKDFWRLRIGIGHPGDKRKVIDYVLGRITQNERRAVDDSLTEVMHNLDDLLSDNHEKFMNRVHSKSS